MTEQTSEQISIVPTVAEEDITTAPMENTQENSYGQFKTKDNLMEAYKSLQAEFTRRSQRLKELEAEVNKQAEDRKWDSKVQALTEAYPVAKGLSGELKEYIGTHKDLVGQEDCLQLALLGVLAERATNQKIAEPAEKIPQQTAMTTDVVKEEAKPVNNSNGEVPTNTADRRARMTEIIHNGGYSDPIPAVMTAVGGEIPVATQERPTDFRAARSVAEVFLKNNK